MTTKQTELEKALQNRGYGPYPTSDPRYTSGYITRVDTKHYDEILVAARAYAELPEKLRGMQLKNPPTMAGAERNRQIQDIINMMGKTDETIKND